MCVFVSDPAISSPGYLSYLAGLALSVGVSLLFPLLVSGNFINLAVISPTLLIRHFSLGEARCQRLHRMMLR